MKHAILILCIILCGKLFSQNLEERIYTATEKFNATRTTEALTTLDSEIKEFEEALKSKDDYLAFINLLINKAYYLEKTHHYQSAISTYEKAWELYKKEKIATVFKYDIIEHCLINLGVLYHKTNNYTNAENTIKYYTALAQSQNNIKQQVVGAVNLANLYQKLGKHNLAIEIAHKGIQLSIKHPVEQRRLQQIKKTSQLTLNENRIAMCGTGLHTPPIPFRFEDQQIAYNAAMQNGDYDKGLKLFRSLMQYWNNTLTSARELAKLKHEEAKIYLLLGRNDEAKKALHQGLSALLPDYNKNSLPETHTLFPENTFIDLFDALAALQKNPENALEYYDLGFYVSNLLSSQITSQEAKLVELASNRRRSENSIALLYQLQIHSDNPIYTQRALQYAENSKAFLLKENLSKKNLLARHPKDSLLIKEQQLLKTQEQLTSKLIKTPYSKPGTDYATPLRDSLNSVNIALRRLQKSIQTRYTTEGFTGIDYNSLKENLQQKEAALVTYFYGNKHIYQFVLTDKSLDFKAIELDKKTISAIQSFIHLFDNASVINNDVSGYTHQAFAMYNTLQLEAIQLKKNIVIIPDGLLNFIPFEALLSSETKSSNFNKMPFLVRDHTIVYNSSVDLYLKSKKQNTANRLLGVFPVFEGTDQALEFTVYEAKSIEQEVDAKFLMYNSATKSSFLEHASQYSILHLSTHASSGDFIVPAHIEFSDETLYLNELYTLNISPKLVVLSACETGIGKLQKGEGPMSLARGFSYAGAKNILFSLWQISDASTARIMALFYKDYSNSESASYANWQSKLKYLDDTGISNSKKSPYYWSAFVYYGSLETPQKNNTSYILISIISILIIVLLLSIFKRQYGKRSQRVPS
ncbi:CHAT domain-containing protein [Bizionia paragorgiae]|uniref:CHAT domain-containing protein n=1 Tax=Bizionia paragorgiae TaxID=283786 RepID=A0A1H4AY31_BIZPA|nr:CHAT domain-containing protein [Bizionia paragorgiae]SEA40708.1 CHAT domain-containing protein [Bizionia paragorgiae]